MKTPDLRARVLLAALVPSAAVTLILTGFFVSARLRDLDTNLLEQCRIEAVQIAAASAYGVHSGNGQSLQSLTDETLAQQAVAAVVIIGTGGEVLARGARRPDLLTLAPAMPGISEERGGLLLCGAPIRPPALLLEDDAAIPPKGGEAGAGRVLLAMDQAVLASAKRHHVLSGLAFSALALSLAAILALRLGRKAVVPIEELEKTVERISQGDFEARAEARAAEPVSGSLGRLSESLNRMAAQLAASRDDMVQRIAQATEELRLRKEDAERANVAKSRFLAAASHDLRQPMHALGLFVGQLQQQTATPETRQLVEQISQSVKALGGLLDGLLDISKLDAGVLSPEPADFPLSQVLQRLDNDFGAAAEDKHLYLRVRPSGLWVRTDPVLLERVLLNLVANAVRYTERGGILVACRLRGGRVRIEVRDSGIGIPSESQESVFQEFVQLTNPGRNRSQGLGLGLAIVRRLVSLLGLRLELRSTPGRGSTFAVEVPRATPVERRAEERAGRPLPGAALDGKVAVVVDDDELVLESVAGILESWGCVVLPASNGRQALERVRRMGLPPDVLLCDYRLLDGEKGTEVVAALRQKQGKTIPAILVSGDTDPDLLQTAREAGLSLLHKPVSPPKLRTLLHRMMGRS